MNTNPPWERPTSIGLPFDHPIWQGFVHPARRHLHPSYPNWLHSQHSVGYWSGGIHYPINSSEHSEEDDKLGSSALDWAKQYLRERRI